MSPRDHFNSMLSALPSSKQSSADRILSLSDVTLLLGSCIGVKSTDFNNVLSLSVVEEEALAVIRFCVWDGSACSVSLDQLRSFLCALPTYRVLQKRLQVMLWYEFPLCAFVRHYPLLLCSTLLYCSVIHFVELYYTSTLSHAVYHLTVR